MATNGAGLVTDPIYILGVDYLDGNRVLAGPQYIRMCVQIRHEVVEGQRPAYTLIVTRSPPDARQPFYLEASLQSIVSAELKPQAAVPLTNGQTGITVFLILHFKGGIQTFLLNGKPTERPGLSLMFIDDDDADIVVTQLQERGVSTMRGEAGAIVRLRASQAEAPLDVSGENGEQTGRVPVDSELAEESRPAQGREGRRQSLKKSNGTNLQKSKSRERPAGLQLDLSPAAKRPARVKAMLHSSEAYESSAKRKRLKKPVGRLKAPKSSAQPKREVDFIPDSYATNPNIYDFPEDAHPSFAYGLGKPQRNTRSSKKAKRTSKADPKIPKAADDVASSRARPIILSSTDTESDSESLHQERTPIPKKIKPPTSSVYDGARKLSHVTQHLPAATPERPAAAPARQTQAPSSLKPRIVAFSKDGPRNQGASPSSHLRAIAQVFSSHDGQSTSATKAASKFTPKSSPPPPQPMPPFKHEYTEPSPERKQKRMRILEEPVDDVVGREAISISLLPNNPIIQSSNSQRSIQISKTGSPIRESDPIAARISALQIPEDARTRPTEQRNLQSSNAKPLPASPLAPSHAITDYASTESVDNAINLCTAITRVENPFVSRASGENPTAFQQMLLEAAQERQINSSPNHEDLQPQASQSSSSSVREGAVSQAESEAWEAALAPEGRSMFDVLKRLNRRVISNIMDSGADVVEHVVRGYNADARTLLEMLLELEERDAMQRSAAGVEMGRRFVGGVTELLQRVS